MRNPNGYGTVAKLSGNRRRPFIVKKVIGWNNKGHPIYDIVGYTETREAGNLLLAEYNRDPWDVDRAKITLQQVNYLCSTNFFHCFVSLLFIIQMSPCGACSLLVPSGNASHRDANLF